MRHNHKKAFIILVIIVVTVFLVGTITTTYAWFLSRYTREYDFVLKSDSPVILKYETSLHFPSGDINTSANVLVPATAKHTVGIRQQALSALDMFDVDVDTVIPAHTGKVQSAAQAVKFTATGAYWTGETATVGEFSFEVKAFLSSYATAQSITPETLSTNGNAAHELTGRGEIDFVAVIHYLGCDILFYDGTYYLSNDEQTDVIDDFDFLGLEVVHWHEMQDDSLDSVGYGGGTIDLYDGTYLLLQPNTTFDLDLYAFVAKTDEELDPEINGQQITLFATIKIE